MPPDALTLTDALTNEVVGSGMKWEHARRARRKMCQGPSGASGASVRLCRADRLDALAARVAGLFLSFRDPEAFHLEKHAVAAELRRLAGEARRHGY